MRRWLAFLMVFLLLAGLLAGCARQEEAPEEETPWYMGEAEDPDQEEEGLSRFALAYRQGESMDPLTCDDSIQFHIANLLYETLFALDETFSPQPLLCSRVEYSEDGTECTLYLRQDVTFSDGTELTAQDVSSSLRRAMSAPRYSGRLSDIRRVAANRDGTVTLDLYQENRNLPALLDIPVVKNGTEDDLIPVGTGPYLYITDGNQAYLSANDAWWQGDGQPVERIDLVNAKDEETVRYLFSTREIQLLVEELTGDSATLTGSLDTEEAASPVMEFIGVNMENQLLASAAVRRAISLGINRQQVVDGYLSGHGLPAVLPVSPVVDADLPSADYAYSSYYSALEEAGLQTGEKQETLTLLVNSESQYKVSAAYYIAEKLSLFDLKVEVEQLPWEEYTDALKRGQFDLYYGEVKLRCDWDVSSLLASGGALNYGGWSNSETDRLLDAFRSGKEIDRQALWDHLTREVPLIPVCFQSCSVLTYSGTVTGMIPTAANVFYNLTDWEIAMAQ